MAGDRLCLGTGCVWGQVVAEDRLWLRTGCARTGSAEETPGASRHGLEWKPIQEPQWSKELFVGPRDEYFELEFPPGYQLMCLDGQSRALAAAKVLPVADRRWIVDLYAAGMRRLLSYSETLH